MENLQLFLKAQRRALRSLVLRSINTIEAKVLYRNRVPLSWHLERNWGDALNPVLVGLLTGRRVLHVTNPALSRYIVVGSILQTADKNTEVWGAGFIRADSTPASTPKAIYAVRGPLTRARLLALGIECPEVYGDPALLLPRYWRAEVDRRHEIGVIPHMVDAQLPWIEALRRNPGVRVIDVQGDLRQFVREVTSCRVILSSSLHGLICADAYGVPSRWIKLSDGLVGGSFKFNDYYLGIGQEPREPEIITADTDVEDIASRAERIDVRCDLEALLRACPFNVNRAGDLPVDPS